MNDGNQIVFHDETPQTPIMKGEKNKLGIVSFALAIVALILGFLPTDAAIVGIIYLVCLIGAFILSIIALSQIKKKNQSGKIYAVIGLVGSILVFAISIILSVVEIGNMSDQEKNDILYCPMVSECVDNGDGTSTCKYVDGNDVICTTKELKADQFE